MNQPSLEDQLDGLLREPIDSVIKREQTTFDELAAPFGRSLVLFGAGGLGRKTLAGLRQVGIEPLAFADNNASLWGREVDGVPVQSPQAAAEQFGDRAAFVVTIWRGEGTDRMPERQQQLRDFGCAKVIPFGSLFWKYPDVFLPHYACDLPHKVYEQADGVRGAFSLWADTSSLREYLAQLRWRMLLDFEGLGLPVTHETYFPDDLVGGLSDEVFVDCGAFDGDTIARFLHRRGSLFRQILAFEPDPANFRALQQYAAALPPAIQVRVAAHQLAVGARRDKVRFSATGTEAAAVGSGTLEVESAALDEVLGDCRPTYIKMDIEGSELDAIMGARHSIERSLPVLAICVYHCQDHLWRIPLLIHSFSDQYRFFLRPHLLEGWDLVCYAVPLNRLTAGPSGR
jgi:FkbM family methyltransferase